MTSTILVVEDERIIAKDIQQTLIAFGYEVPHTVATGERAVQAIVASRPDLVLMDISLGGSMDGIEATREIWRRFGVPCVYLTSYSDEETLMRATTSGSYGYLLKPFSDRELRITIEMALAKRRMEVQLAERERWFATTLESLGDAVIATDRAEKVTFLNGVAERLTGWTRGDAVGKRIDEVMRMVHPDGAPIKPAVDLVLQRAINAHIPNGTALLPREGPGIAIDDCVSPIVDEEGQVLGAVVVFRDVTKRNDLERRLVQSERLATIGTMAASAAHEINNPLAYVIANIGLTQEGIRASILALRSATVPVVLEDLLRALVEGEEALDDASDGADRIKSIVRDLKKFSRVDESERALVDLPEVLDAAAKMTNSVVRHNATFRKEYGATPGVEANAGQLTQVFSNLLINAAESIGAGDAAHQEIRILSFADDRGRAIVEIRDSGPGIPADVLARVFDPFFTTKGKGGGTGLGLAICQRIITTLGGEITVESEVGKGTTFRVALPPAAERPTSAEVRAAAAAAPCGRRGTILVIDDDAAIGRALARMLRPEHDVEVLTDARAALAKIAVTRSFDVIFCDLMMPNLTGMDFFAALSTEAPELAQRVVFMSGGAFSPRAEEFVERTTNPIIAKPFTSEEVRRLARDYVK